MLYDQYTDYQQLQDITLNGYQRIDYLWHYLGNLQGSDSLRFNLLFEVVKYILLLLHSNAEGERIFSTVAKNKTKFRASLTTSTSVPSILTCKTNCFNHVSCFKFQPSKSLLEKSKKAATTYNAEHSNSSDS